jgi:hypothetical protein
MECKESTYPFSCEEPVKCELDHGHIGAHEAYSGADGVFRFGAQEVGRFCAGCKENKALVYCGSCQNKKRSFQLMSRNMAALIPKMPGGTPGISDDYFRAAGGAICPKCGLEFIEHPLGMEEFLHLLCDGKQVKL